MFVNGIRVAGPNDPKPPAGPPPANASRFKRIFVPAVGSAGAQPGAAKATTVATNLPPLLPLGTKLFHDLPPVANGLGPNPLTVITPLPKIPSVSLPSLVLDDVSDDDTDDEDIEPEEALASKQQQLTEQAKAQKASEKLRLRVAHRALREEQNRTRQQGNPPISSANKATPVQSLISIPKLSKEERRTANEKWKQKLQEVAPVLKVAPVPTVDPVLKVPAVLIEQPVASFSTGLGEVSDQIEEGLNPTNVSNTSCSDSKKIYLLPLMGLVAIGLGLFAGVQWGHISVDTTLAVGSVGLLTVAGMSTLLFIKSFEEKKVNKLILIGVIVPLIASLALGLLNRYGVVDLMEKTISGFSPHTIGDWGVLLGGSIATFATIVILAAIYNGRRLKELDETMKSGGPGPQEQIKKV